MATLTPITLALAALPGALDSISLVLPAAIVWVLFFDPAVIIDEHRVTLIGVVRTVRIPLSRIRLARVRYSFEVVTDADEVFEAWALPRGARMRESIADEAASEVNERIAIAEPSSAPLTRSWNVRSILIVASALAVAAVSLQL
ncbi:hypothetical protein [Rarobacter incanus]|uniref:hypothetical protein n=1 Tax=Rarobacter incanus TaxID=153494 RepID=UPI001151B9E1|nr:hypothetical protein [Rarobacter incanus]